MDRSKRFIFLCLGLAAVSMAFIGVFLPLIPTTPFLLLAAFFFSKSSERLHNWLLEHRIFGKLIRDWRDHRAISTRAKVLSIAVIIPVFGYTLVFHQFPFPLKAIIASVGIAASIFILTRRGVPVR